MNKEVGWCEELNKSDKWDFRCNKFPKCPHCGYEYEDFCDNYYILEDGDHEMNCYDCGYQFTVNTSVSYTFSTSEQEDFDGDN